MRLASSSRLRVPVLSAAVALGAASCASFVEVPIETPLQSKLDVTPFRRVLVAGFATEPGAHDVDAGPETVRLLQNQLRSASKLQVVEPDRPPLQDALDRIAQDVAPSGTYGKDEQEQYRLETDRVIGDPTFWRKVGEEFKGPLIVTGRVNFEEQNRSGYASDERVVRDPGTGQPRLVRGNRYLERKAFALTAEFVFVDGRTGETLHKEKFTEEVLHNEEQKVSPLSSYFELMDRVLPNFLGVISPQKVRGTRILLR
jgi:hypothetical protein